MALRYYEEGHCEQMIVTRINRAARKMPRLNRSEARKALDKAITDSVELGLNGNQSDRVEVQVGAYRAVAEFGTKLDLYFVKKLT